MQRCWMGLSMKHLIIAGPSKVKLLMLSPNRLWEATETVFTYVTSLLPFYVSSETAPELCRNLAG